MFYSGCWICQSAFGDCNHAQTPNGASGLAELKSAPDIITDFPLLLPNSTGCNLHSSVFKLNHSDKINTVERS